MILPEQLQSRLDFIEQLEAMSIKVELVDHDVLLEVVETAGGGEIDRGMVNHIRHRLSPYDSLLRGMVEKVGQDKEMAVIPGSMCLLKRR